MSENKSAIRRKIEQSLSNKSELVYIFPAIPTVINFVLAIVTGAIYVSDKYLYQSCQNILEDRVWVYNLGALIIHYLFLVFYSNVLVEFVPFFRGIFFNFVFLFVWFVFSIIWNVIGAGFVSSGKCGEVSNYHSIATANIVIFFTQIFLLLVYLLYLFVQKRRSQGAVISKQPAKINQEPVINK